MSFKSASRKRPSGARRRGSPPLSRADLRLRLFGLFSLFALELFGAKALAAERTVVAWGDNTFSQCTVPVQLTNALAVAAGGSHSLALKGDGTVLAWGLNNNHQIDLPLGLTNVAGIAAGLYHNLALKSDGRVVAWGLNSTGQTNVPSTLSNAVAVAAGQAHSLALKADGTVVAWGNNSFGQSTVPPGLTNVAAIAAGYLHSLALRSNGTVIAWGNQTNVPTDLTNVVAIASGQAHGLALKGDGTVVAWGANGSGQTAVPANLSGVIAIAAGANHSLALRIDGTIVAWGANGSGQSNVPASVRDAVAISGGGSHSLAIASAVPPYFLLHPVSQSVLAGTNVLFTALAQGSAPLGYRWQFNGLDILAATNASLLLPVARVSDSGSYACIVTNSFGASTSHVAALSVQPFLITSQPQSRTVLALSNAAFRVVVDGEGPFTFQWKKDGIDLPGNNQFGGSQSPTLVMSNILPADAGNYKVEVKSPYGTIVSSNATLAVVPLVVWGDNTFGQRNIPLDLTNVASVAAGWYHNLALRRDGRVTAWGYNASGQTNVPAGLSNVVAIAAGYQHSLALRWDGTLVAWGDNSLRQRAVPPDLTNVVAIAAGEFHSLALRSDGTVVAWGYNAFGQTNVPVGLTNVVAISAGDSHSLALKANGSVTAWGSNASVQTNMPPYLTNAVAIAAGGSHNLVLRYHNTPLAWGLNDHGQISVPPGLTDAVAVAAGGALSLALRYDGTVVSWGQYQTGSVYVPATVPAALSNVQAIAAGVGGGLALCSALPPAFPQTLQWSTFGDAPWFTQTNFTHDGNSAYQTGPIADSDESWLQTTVTGPGVLTFWWKVSSEEDADELTFLLDNEEEVWISGEVDWEQQGFVIPEGVHTLQWLYARDSDDFAGQNAGWVAQVSFVPVDASTPPIILIPPQNIQVAAGSSVTLSVSAFSDPPLTYQWQFEGVDLPGATNSDLTLTNVKVADNGRYRAIVSSLNGSVTSSYGCLSVVVVVAWDFPWRERPLLVPASLTNVLAVATGGAHNLALRADGTVVAWGGICEFCPDYGQTNVPAGLTNVVAIAAGGDFSLALRGDGTVVAWGDNQYGQTNVPAGLTNVVSVAAEDTGSLALRADGTVVAWGRFGQTSVPAGLNNVVSLAKGGGGQILAVRADGTLVTLTSSGLAQVPEGLTNVVAVSGFSDNFLALQANGAVVTWGYSTNVPPGLTNVVDVAAGSYDRFAVRTDGSVAVWDFSGFNSDYFLPGTWKNIATISSWEWHGLALVGNGPAFFSHFLVDRTGAIGGNAIFQANGSGAPALSYQWQFDGTNLPYATNALLVLTNVQPAQEGDYSVTVSNPLGAATSHRAHLSVVPAWFTTPPEGATPPLGGTVTLSARVRSSVPVSYQWRFNGVDLDGATNSSLRLSNLTYAASGGYSIVANNAYGAVISAEAIVSVVAVAAWGDNSEGQTDVPPGLTNVLAIAAGDYHSLALLGDETVVSWGFNGNGQTNVPAGLTNVVAVAAGGSHSLALRANGSVAVWGANDWGQTNVPAGLTDVVAIAAGGQYSLALLANGTVLAWGRGWSESISVPSFVTNVVAIDTSYALSLALSADGAVVAWNNSDARIPPPSSLTNIVAVAAGNYLSMALRADGTVAEWNSSGERPVPASLTNIVAIACGDLGHNLVLRADGTLEGWWQDHSGQLDTPTGLTKVLAIASGGVHDLALVGDGWPVSPFQPASHSVVAGGTASFTASLVGRGPLAYQWRFKGTNIDGATNRTLTIANVQLAQRGDYTVLASNAFGVVTGKPVQLEVLVPPSLNAMPDSEAVIAGSDLTLGIDATGTPPLRYQWRKNGVNILGATNSTLTITNVQVSDGASYSVVVANAVGSANSDPTVLVVEVASQAPPEDDFVHRRLLTGTNGFASGTNTFATREPDEPRHADKFGSNSVWYKWTAPANGIATFRTVGSTFDTLLGVYTGTNVGALTFVASDEDRGGFLTSQARFNVQMGVEYEIAVDGFAGQQGPFILNWDLEETAQQLPVIVTAPVSQTVTIGSSATFGLSATGSGLTYQWFHNFKRINGATGPLLQLGNVQPQNVGLYTVAITNSAGRGVESLPVSLEIGPVAGVQSVGKIEDLLNPGGSGFAPLIGPHGKGSASAGPTGGELLVGMGTINSQILNNTSPTNSGVSLPQACSGIGGSARTLVLTATNSGTMVIDTVSSSIDTLLAVYTFSGGGFNTFVCDNNSADGLQSLVRFEATAGTRYFVAADGANGAQGTIYLNWAMGRAPTVTATPTNPVVARGGQVLLSVAVQDGIPPARCQWLRNNQVLAGATNTTLLLTNLQPANAGVYSVLVSNAIQSILQLVAGVALEPELASLIGSRFEQDSEAWSFTGDASWLYLPTGGRYGGCLSALSQRTGGKWNWVAPGKFFGNQGVAYGGSLRFDLKQSGGGSSSAIPPRLSLSGNGLTIYFQTSLAPGPSWTSYQIQLKEGNPGWMRSDNTVALGFDLQRVLANVTALQISGQFSAASESSSLEAVEFLAPCTDEAPQLSMRWQADPAGVILEWPASALCYQLEMAASLAAPNWSTNFSVIGSSLSNGIKSVTVPWAGQGLFFRLRKD